ncbi:MAG: hypothetical protein LC730_03175 [Acidobacteria bacterium]|nr:hypothetical protein [Acidobacteriota bacterium]
MNDLVTKPNFAVERVEMEPNAETPALEMLVPIDSAEVPTSVSKKNLTSEDKALVKKESEIEKNYRGLRGYFRLLHITSVIGRLALFLYLDQYDTHRKGQIKQANARLATAHRLTRLAVYGEKLYALRMWFLHVAMLLVRRLALGAEPSREVNQEKQSVWLIAVACIRGRRLRSRFSGRISRPQLRVTSKS